MLDSVAFFKPGPTMRRPYGPRSLLRVSIVLVLFALLGTQVSGCGQRGPLYLPDKENPDKRR